MRFDNERHDSTLQSLFEECRGHLSMVPLINNDSSTISGRGTDEDIPFHWDALFGVLHERKTELTVLISGREIPEWFNLPLTSVPCEVILSPTSSSWCNPKFRGLAICARISRHVRATETINIRNYSTEQTTYKGWIESEFLLLFHYAPALEYKPGSPCFSETTTESKHKICLVEAWLDPHLKNDDSPNPRVEWAMRLVYEDETIEINHDEHITVTELSRDPSKVGSLMVTLADAGDV